MGGEYSTKQGITWTRVKRKKERKEERKKRVEKVKRNEIDKKIRKRKAFLKFIIGDYGYIIYVCICIYIYIERVRGEGEKSV